MKHSIAVRPVMVNDGSTYPPTEMQIDKQILVNEDTDASLEPHDKGYVHARGKARPTQRFEWTCTDGKSSNGCTYPTKESAFNEAEKHLKKITK